MFLLFYAWPLMATMVSLDLITGHPVRTERWLFNILMVFWGAWIYGTILFLGLTVRALKKRNSSNDSR